MSGYHIIASSENGRPTTEAIGTPVDARRASATPLTESNAGHDSLQARVQRFLDALRSNQGMDAEAEIAEPDLCRTCMEYPAAISGRCFRCNADRRLPS